MTDDPYRVGWVDTTTAVYPKNSPPFGPVDASPWLHLPAVLNGHECAEVIDAAEPNMERRHEYFAGETTADLWSEWLWDTKQWSSLYHRVWTLMQRFAITHDIKATGMYEPIRVLGYEVGQHIGWHADYHRYDNSKVTCIVQLNDPDSYVGGSLRLLNLQAPRLAVGDALIFPSYVAHEVTPIRRGTRYVLTGWAAGPAYV